MSVKLTVTPGAERDALLAELQTIRGRAAEIETALKIVPAWRPGIAVKADEVYRYGGNDWRIVQDHTTAAQWTPGSPGLTALYAPA